MQSVIAILKVKLTLLAFGFKINCVCAMYEPVPFQGLIVIPRCGSRCDSFSSLPATLVDKVIEEEGHAPNYAYEEA